MTTLYRATDTGYTGPGSCWSSDAETAQAYTDNPGFGGSAVVEMELPADARVLDVRGPNGVDMAALAEALGYGEGQAAEWRMSGYLYPWEESSRVAARLAESGYDWLLYHDDYPEMAVTYRRITAAD